MDEQLQNLCKDRFQFVQFQGALDTRRAPRKPAAARWRSPAHLRPAGAPRPDDIALLSWLFERCALDHGRYRIEPLVRRVPACCRALHVASPTEALALLRREPDLAPQALSTLVLGVSEFFRDRAVFHELRVRILPALAVVRRDLRIASIGCSDGRELYSLAMLLAELGLLDDSRLLGLDCRTEAIAQARAGLFSFAALDPVPPELRGRYFETEQTGCRIGSVLRLQTCWAVADLFDLPALPACDLVLYRNLTIYLKPDWAAQAWRRVVPLVRPGGFLIVGKAERPPETAGLVRISPCVFRRDESIHDE